MNCKKSDDTIVVINQDEGKIIGIVQGWDENWKPNDWYWAISTNKDFFDSDNFLADDYVLGPDSIPVEFRRPNLRVIFSGRKHLDKHYYLTLPNVRGGFGYYFELTEIKIKNK